MIWTDNTSSLKLHSNVVKMLVSNIDDITLLDKDDITLLGEGRANFGIILNLKGHTSK